MGLSYSSPARPRCWETSLVSQRMARPGSVMAPVVSALTLVGQTLLAALRLAHATTLDQITAQGSSFRTELERSRETTLGPTPAELSIAATSATASARTLSAALRLAAVQQARAI